MKTIDTELFWTIAAFLAGIAWVVVLAGVR